MNRGDLTAEGDIDAEDVEIDVSGDDVVVDLRAPGETYTYPPTPHSPTPATEPIDTSRFVVEWQQDPQRS